MNRPKPRKVLDCASPLALSIRDAVLQERQRTGALQDAGATMPADRKHPDGAHGVTRSTVLPFRTATRDWNRGILARLPHGLCLVVLFLMMELVLSAQSFGVATVLGPPISQPNVGERGPSLSRDGLSLYYGSDVLRPVAGSVGDHDLWVATRASVSSPWGQPRNLRAINTTGNELFPAISADDLSLFFSDWFIGFGVPRPGSFGNGDLWVSRRASSQNEWQPAINLGSTVNTSFIEATPSISSDGLTLIFMSDRPGNMPGSGTGRNALDFWITTRINASDPTGWGPPVHLGAVVNSIYADESPNLSGDGLALYFTSNRPNPVHPAGRYDLWVARRNSVSEPFGAPESLAAHFAAFYPVFDPYLSADGSTLFFQTRGLLSNPAPRGDLWQVPVLQLQLPPAIVTQPQSQTVNVGTNVTFNVSVTGTLPLNYQWQFNGTNIANATNPALLLTNVQSSAGGTYSVMISNAFGSVTSSNATLIVITPFSISEVSVVPRPMSAIVTWTTSTNATSQVEYGVSTNYENASPLSSALVTNHAVLLLGLLPETDYLFRVLSRVATNEYRSASLTFSTAITLVLDNPQVSYSGIWTLGTSSPDKYGAYYQYATTTTEPLASAQAIYRPNIVTPGKYNVHVWYPEGSNRSTSAQVMLFHDGGSVAKSVNQTSGGGAWQLVASSRDFVAGTSGFAAVGNNTGESAKVIMADAMRWSYVASQDIPTDGTVPAWWANFFFGTDVNASLDPDADGYATYVEYVLGTVPTNFNSRLRTWVEPAAGLVQILFSPWLSGRNYQLQSASSLNSPVWATLTNVPAVSNGAGRFLVEAQGRVGLGAQTSVRFDSRSGMHDSNRAGLRHRTVKRRERRVPFAKAAKI